MKILYKIFFTAILITLLVVAYRLTKSLKRAQTDFDCIQKTVFSLYSQHNELKSDINLNNDYILQFSENEDFIDQMIREQTGHIKHNEIIYKFEEK